LAFMTTFGGKDNDSFAKQAKLDKRTTKTETQSIFAYIDMNINISNMRIFIIAGSEQAVHTQIF
ncbi:MAG: hypothetical protein KAS59_06415, partial [Alphaproteobacteria bacterium]|nr:hypothetical protein [Alphaproteobacteria bacterium]